MADHARRHLPGRRLEHLLHQHSVVWELAGFLEGIDRSWRGVDDMELVCSLALIRQYRPSAQVPIGPEIVLRHMHIPVCINYGLCVLALRDAATGAEVYDCSHGNDSGAETLHGRASSPPATARIHRPHLSTSGSHSAPTPPLLALDRCP